MCYCIYLSILNSFIGIPTEKPLTNKKITDLALQICVKNFSFTKHRIDLNLSTIKNFPLLLFLFIAVNNPITCLLGAADLLISKMPGYTLLSKRTNKQAQKEIQKNI